MTCAANLGAADFIKLGVAYSVCVNCGHLNGHHQDTDAYCEQLYTDNEGESYGRVYSSTDTDTYHARVEKIYSPKASFLFEGLRADRVDPAPLRYADFGAGSGYFLTALAGLGAEQIIGYEVSRSQINLAHEMSPDVRLEWHDLSGTTSLARACTASVVSMIGVLEHLQQPRELLEALRRNEEVRYLFVFRTAL